MIPPLEAQWSQLAASLSPGGWTDAGTYESLTPLGGQTEIPTRESLEAMRESVTWAINNPVPLEVQKRQLCLALHSRGILPSAIDDLLDGNVTGQIEWQTTATVRRIHPLVTALAGQLNLSTADVDAIFREAATL